MPLAAVSPAMPRLQMPQQHQQQQQQLDAPDSKLQLLAALSELELSLLIAAARLDIVLNTDTVNFAMAYDEYVSLMGKQRVQSSLAAAAGRSGNGKSSISGGLVLGGGARVWGRGVAARAGSGWRRWGCWCRQPGWAAVDEAVGAAVAAAAVHEQQADWKDEACGDWRWSWRRSPRPRASSWGPYWRGGAGRSDDLIRLCRLHKQRSMGRVLARAADRQAQTGS